MKIFGKTLQENIISLLEQYKKLDIENAIDFTKFNQYLVSHHSTSLEGSTLTYIETTVLLENGLTPKGKPLVHTLMQKDHYEALLFAIKNARNTPYTPDFIQKINSKLMHSTGQIYYTIFGEVDGTKGEYRKGMVYAGQSSFVNHTKIEGFVQKLCEKINENLETDFSVLEKLIFSFQIHYELVNIHPFYDVNGRTSRLLMNVLQTYWNLPLAIVFTEDKTEYIEAILASRTSENTESFVDFMFSQYQKHLSNLVNSVDIS
ncbi:MAG: Fic family protein [Bacteroidetes bacterium]|nr:MAG: Fic family protein [Bacteroidota bacterium]